MDTKIGGPWVLKQTQSIRQFSKPDLTRNYPSTPVLDCLLAVQTRGARPGQTAAGPHPRFHRQFPGSGVCRPKAGSRPCRGPRPDRWGVLTEMWGGLHMGISPRGGSVTRRSPPGHRCGCTNVSLLAWGKQGGKPELRMPSSVVNPKLSDPSRSVRVIRTGQFARLPARTSARWVMRVEEAVSSNPLIRVYVCITLPE